MILFRIGFIALVLFLLIFGFLRLCFSRGYVTRERLKRWNRNVSLTFSAIILVTVIMSMIAGVDQNL